MIRSVSLWLLLANFVSAQTASDGATASFRGALPPKPTAPLTSQEESQLQSRLDGLSSQLEQLPSDPFSADVAIFLKAVQYAVDFDEWYDKESVDSLKKANALLDEAQKRIESLKANQTPWIEGTGFKVLGFYSKMDGSAQPYGVELPGGTKLDREAPLVPMWIWLHGRGDKTTDLNFIYSQLTAKKPGKFQPANTVIIHPFGRYCNGWKSAGETDVFEARDDAMKRFPIDPRRIALAGFSMGGAGAWHMGAHFADQWAAVHAGAGFVDVRRYQNLTLETMPCWFEQKLWGVYDVPNYARNFTNVPLIAYSGEMDKQRDAAEYMVEVLAAEGIQPPHFIGPGMGHAYHPEVLKQVESKIEKAVAVGRPSEPKRVVLQTRTLAYNRMHWLKITGLDEHWLDSRIEAEWDAKQQSLAVSLHNVRSFAVQLPKPKSVSINGLPATMTESAANGQIWEWHKPGSQAPSTLTKRPGLQGPIDDAFRSPFLVVLPDRESPKSQVTDWVNEESAHFMQRWRSLMRGEPRSKPADQVTKDDLQKFHLILWGTPKSNSLIERFLNDSKVHRVVHWDVDTVKIGSVVADASNHVPVLVYPSPFADHRYVVLNSGLTFRESHDRTNSLQNPKLPDWSILDIRQPPNAELAGKVVAADFFDETWSVRPNMKSPGDRE